MTTPRRLEMSRITKAFGGAPAIADGNLILNAGEVDALMGANGAGKSTMMNILGGVIAKDSGTIILMVNLSNWELQSAQPLSASERCRA
ncbi:ATP-binding cassette domain-containing protein [Sinorhizobium meliloti]|uniref:ATP-binding cassette domain-containing protein n=1 Tax=Rhizobium meliloti TaxID=382 RepID=UPI00398CA199